ncbi:MAG: beta-galactosidase [Bacteroidota bacterium]
MKPFIVLALLIISLVGESPLKGQQLYVGTNYHPHDNKDPEKIREDIRMMKEAGFTVVRLGHLAWDSYELSEGQFDFEWFDEVMDLFAEAEIGVILDIAIRPAPLWLHQMYPSIDIVDENGDVQYPNHRYMEDVGDPDYQKYALRFTDVLTRRYAGHPALLAFGIDNESGDGRISYSETVRQRFISWLKMKYSNLDRLNSAWATQRWSRRLNDWEEIGLPPGIYSNDMPEKMLDFRQFISYEVQGILFKVLEVVNTNAPGTLTNTNAWYFSSLKYFDYAPLAYSGKMTRQGEGFYPGLSLNTNWGVMNASFGISRIQFESENPFWCSEFTTMTAVPGSIRKSAYASLMYGNQMVCGWTWQSMWAGEEQYLIGMLDWDGIPNRKYDEYKQIAEEFRKIEEFFPYKLKAEIGLAYSFPSQIASRCFPVRHDNQVQACWDLCYWRNIDSRMLDIRYSDLDYKLIMIPGHAVMDELRAEKIRNYVKNGGTVVMTSNSAITDTTGQVFSTRRPGLLSDVFGIRLGAYEETEAMNELSAKAFTGNKLEISYDGKAVNTESARFDLVYPEGAEVLGYISGLDKNYPIITSNHYGKGRAIYVGLPADGNTLGSLFDDLINELGIKKGPDVPSGIMARQIDEKHFLYLNVSGESKEIALKGKAKSILSGKSYNGSFSLAPYEPEFIEIK